jgi:hypothetical protein
MPGDGEELDKFKRQVNLTEYAATLGYVIDRKASSRNSAVMRHPAGDKIVVAKGEDLHWVYFSVGDPADHGSIIDFVQRRGMAETYGDVRKLLRPWSGGAAPPGGRRTPAEAFAANLEPNRKDLIAVRVRYEAMLPLETGHPYLEDARQIPWHVLTDPLFVDRIRADAYGNAVFPHINLLDGLCGYEVKGKGVTRFATGGTKGLWCSRVGREDMRLVVAETAIDALSFAALKYQPGTRYVSTAGQLNPDQPLLLKRAMEKLPDGGEVVLAVDNDDGGTAIGTRIEAIFATVNRPGLALVYDRPKTVKDWNDALRSSPLAHSGPASAPRPRFR